MLKHTLDDPADDDPEFVRANELTEQVGDIVERIGRVPTTTLAGALVKVRAVLANAAADWARSQAVGGCV